MPESAPPVAFRSSSKPKRKKLSSAGAKGSGKAGVGVKDAGKVPTRRKMPSIGELVGAGAKSASAAPAGSGIAAISPKGASTDRAASLGTKLVRTAGITAGATLEARLRDPVKQTGKDVTGARDAVKGLIGLLGAAYTVPKELITEGQSKSGSKLLHDVGKDYNRRLGGAFRGDPGAYRKQLARQRREGSFPEELDLLSVGAPISEAVTGAVKGVAAIQKSAGKVGTRAQRAVAATKSRAPLRESAGHVAQQKPRRTVPGAAATKTLDAARKGVQRRAEVRAVAGGKPLSERRASVQPGEVAAISERRAAARARKRLAKTARVERQVSAAQIHRELTSRKGGRDRPEDRTTRRNMQELPSATHRDAAQYAHQYGIRDAAGAKVILKRRIAQIEKERAKQPLTPGELAAARDELPTLRALLESPHIFEHPAVQRAADVEVARADRLSGPEAGLAPDRHLAAKYQPQADTLGVQRHAKDESTLAYAQRIAPELGVRPPTDEAVHALAREKGITRQAAAHEANQRFMRDVGKAKIAASAAHLSRRTADEPAKEFVGRVQAEASKHGLVEPGYTPSRSNAANAAEQRHGVSGSADAPAGTFAAREGSVFRRGLERKDPELLVSKLAQTVRQGARLKAEAELLQREGKRFDSKSAASEWMEAHHVDPATVTLVNDPVVRKGQASPSGPDRGAYVPTDATYVVPKNVMKEWDRQHAAPSAFESGAAKLQSVTQAALLGTSPAWFQFQILADSITLGAAGGAHKLISANREYRRMSDADRELVDVLIGGSPANDILIGNASDQLGRMASVLATSPSYRKFVQGRRPLTALLRAEGARSSAFRRAAFAAKAARIDKSIVASRAPMARIQHALGKTDSSPGDLANALARPHTAEAAAEHVNKIMGDFANYTAAERRALKSIVPFYGFLRYSLRTVFYTLPIEHPYLAALSAQLGRLTSDEARDLVGPDLPYGLSAFYNADGTKAVDFSRASPVLNSFTASSTAGQLESGLLPPLAVLALNAGFGRNLFKGKDYKVGGSASPTDGADLTPEDRARIFAHELINFLSPARAYEKTLPPQSDDTLPFSRRNIQALDPATAASIDSATASVAKQSRWERFLHELMPLATPQQATHNAAAGARATERRRLTKERRSNQAAKREALTSDPLEALKFQAAQQKAAVEQQVAGGVDQDYLNSLLEAAGLKP